MRALLLAATGLLASAAALARPSVVKLACVLGDGRTHLMVPQASEADSDDALICQLELGKVTEEAAADLVGELRVVRPDRRQQVVAIGDLEPREDRFRRASVELVAPHENWFPSVDWKGKSPRVHLVVTVRKRDDSLPREQWTQVLTSRLDLGHRRVYAGTPSLKSSQPPRPDGLLRAPVALSRSARRAPPARAGATPARTAPVTGSPYDEGP
jgi:hypothetical protein